MPTCPELAAARPGTEPRRETRFDWMVYRFFRTVVVKIRLLGFNRVEMYSGASVISGRSGGTCDQVYVLRSVFFSFLKYITTQKVLSQNDVGKQIFDFTITFIHF